jgi:hypothetical protein
LTAPWRRVEGGVELFVRVAAKAGADRVAGLWRGAEARERLAVRVAAAPEKGRANDAVIRLLAAQSELAPSMFAVTAGETGRLKTVRIAGDAAQIETRLAALLTRVQGAMQQ